MFYSLVISFLTSYSSPFIYYPQFLLVRFSILGPLSINVLISHILRIMTNSISSNSSLTLLDLNSIFLLMAFRATPSTIPASTLSLLFSRTIKSSILLLVFPQWKPCLCSPSFWGLRTGLNMCFFKLPFHHPYSWLHLKYVFLLFCLEILSHFLTSSSNIISSLKFFLKLKVEFYIFLSILLKHLLIFLFYH